MCTIAKMSSSLDAQRVITLALALVALTTAAYAGSCADEIDRMVARTNSGLEAAASAAQNLQADMHRQLTPSSIAAAATRLGELAPEAMEAVTAALAREEDRAGVQNACEQALAEVHTWLARCDLVTQTETIECVLPTRLS
jgi:hypothetical protein